MSLSGNYVSSPRSRTRILALVAVLAAATAACDDKQISEAGLAATTITVTPNPQTMAVGTTQQFTATGKDPNGGAAAITPIWSAGSGGTISATGVFTAGTVPGTYPNTVKAASGGIAGSATVTVVAGALATITVTPNPVSLAIGATQTYTAVGRDAFSNEVAITPTWTVAAGGGAISSAGVFTAGTAAGTFPNTVTATSGTIVGRATVTVLPGALASIVVTPNPQTVTAGLTQQFTAEGRDANNNVVAITPTWSISNGGGTISTAGLFTAGASAGTFPNTVRATSGTIFGSATVTVTLPLATITVTPNPATVPTNGTQQFTAVGRDANGGIVAITPVWSATAGGTIGTGGLFTAGTVAGVFTNAVRATSGTISGTASVTVTGPLATLVVSPDPATVAPNATQQFTAVGRDANGVILTITPTWSVVNSGGSINASGLFTAGPTAGTFTNTVRALSGTLADSATVVVAAAIPPGPNPTVNLASAALNGIMAGQSVTCVTGGIVNANVAISPGSTITGFGPCVITGVQNLANAVALQAQIDLVAAYNTLAGLPCPPANAIVANLGSTVKPAGVYCSASSIGVTGTLTLDGGGDPNALFVFQAGSTLTTAGNIVLIGGAQAKNVYWQVGSSATIGVGSQWQGNIVALQDITLVNNATLTGRALARNGSVTLGTGNIIILP